MLCQDKDFYIIVLAYLGIGEKHGALKTVKIKCVNITAPSVILVMQILF